MVKLQNTVQTKENRIKTLENNIKNLELEKFNINGKLVECRDENNKLHEEIQNLINHNNGLNDDLLSCRRDLENTQLVFCF